MRDIEQLSEFKRFPIRHGYEKKKIIQSFGIWHLIAEN